MALFLSTSSSLLFFFFAFLSASAYLPDIGGLAGAGDGDKSLQREFDFFTLSLQWPGTFCLGTTQCCSDNGCCRGSKSPTHFTINGLWPDYNDGSYPSCCYRSDFNENEISSLRDTLEENWPSLSCVSPSTCHRGKGSFWRHQWEKHGTCGSPVIPDQYSYFNTTLKIYFKYNLTDVLYEAGYVASDSEKYPLGDIVTTIQNALHINPQVICKEDVVDEIRLCFEKDFKPRDCVGSKKSCPTYVSLPEYTPLDAEAMLPKMPTDKRSYLNLKRFGSLLSF